jgi:hypothetical protein
MPGSARFFIHQRYNFFDISHCVKLAAGNHTAAGMTKKFLAKVMLLLRLLLQA